MQIPEGQTKHIAWSSVILALIAAITLGTQSAAAQPNLTPYVPLGWSDAIVVSKASGTSTDDTALLPSDTLFIDWAVLNNGNSAAGLFSVALYVDGSFLGNFNTNATLNSNSYVFYQDFNIGSLGAGIHSISIVADSGGAISESNESDNSYTKYFGVSTPNLQPYIPSGWSDAIVVSKVTGTNTDSSPLAPTDTLFIDWAVINDGSVASSQFDIGLYVDGSLKNTFTSPASVPANTYTSFQDYNIGSLGAGQHTIQIYADPEGAISEGNELDNVYTKQITIAGASSASSHILPDSLFFGPSPHSLYVETDWMIGSDHNHMPSQAVLDEIVATFKAEGFKLHIDLSNGVAEKTPMSISTSISNPVTNAPDVMAISSANFNHSADPKYHYNIFAHNYQVDGSFTSSSGIADLPGRTFLVTLGSFPPSPSGTFNNQVGTFIHEFGHNLGQQHGGNSGDNYKPNYPSIMNYLYQLDGVGLTAFNLNFVHSALGINNFGYSHGLQPVLDENNLNENIGMGWGKPVDWNCNASATQTGVSEDINEQATASGFGWCGSTGEKSVLTDFDNWASVPNFLSRPTNTGNESTVEPCITAEEYLESLKKYTPAQRAALLSEPVKNAADALVNTGSDFHIHNDSGNTLAVSSIALDSAASYITWSPTAPFNVTAGNNQKVSVKVNMPQAPSGNTQRRLLITTSDPSSNPFPNGVYINVNNVIAFSPSIDETYTTTTGWSQFGSANPNQGTLYDSANTALIGHISPVSGYRIIGWMTDASNSMLYSTVGSNRFVRAKYYVYATGQSGSAVNQIPNFRVRVANRFAVTGLLTVSNHNASDPEGATLGQDIRPSNSAQSPSIYRVDLDPVDVPQLVNNPTTEGFLRAFEVYEPDAQANGNIGVTESEIGSYPALANSSTIVAVTQNGLIKRYVTGATDAGDFGTGNPASSNSAATLAKYFNGSLEATGPQPGFSVGSAGVTLQTLSIESNRFGVAAFDVFNDTADQSNRLTRARVEPSKQYKVRFHATSTINSNTQSVVRFRARTLKFQYTASMEVGGSTGASTQSNTIAAQALPGVGNQIPTFDRISPTENGGWYNVLMTTPMSTDIQASQPNIAAQDGPGVNTGGTGNTKSRRDLQFGFDVIDTFSAQPTSGQEKGQMTVDRVEIEKYDLVPD